MSHTHKTAPFWVRLRHGTLKAVAHHDHSLGPCDLPAAVGRDWWMRDRRCNYEFRYTGVRTCCCPMCHAVEYPDRTERQRRRRERRSRRRTDREQLRSVTN